jgi:PAS domain S-box-containing protein
LKEELSYHELYQRYLDLQFRVTQFSSIEQELINTRDKLDHELVVYKRMNNFISKALRYRSINELLELVSESIIDIFELQIGYVHYKAYKDESNSEDFFYILGHNKTEENALIRDFQELESLNILSGKMKEFSPEEMSGYLNGHSLHHCLISKKIMVGSNCQLVLGAATDVKNAPSYNYPDNRKQALFIIFIQQVETLVNNLLTFEKNREQMKIIGSSEIELRKLSLIATNTNNAVIITDPYGRIEWVNGSFEKSTGYTLEEVKGLKPKDFLQVRDERTAEVRQNISNALIKKEFVEVEILNKNKYGDEYVISLQISPIFDKDGDLVNFIALQRDVTTEVKYRKEIERVNYRMDQITRGSSIGMWEYNIEDKTAEWNDVLFEMYDVERTAKDLHRIWNDRLHPEDVEKVMRDIEQMIQGEKNTSVIEYRILSGKEKKDIKYLKTIAFREIDQNKKTNKILGSTVDISVTKNFEKDILHKNKELTKINGELDQFVYSVSHDLRSPLLSIKGILSVIDDSSDLTEIQSYHQLIEKSVDRLDSTILEILDFSRNARLDHILSKFNIRELTENIFKDLAYVTNEKIDLRCHIVGPEIIEQDRPRLEILLKNLISNGIKYRRKSDENSFVEVSVFSDSSDYKIFVKDNGEGISEENQKKVFDMFFRASSSSPGTGLGLYICKDIVSKMKGKINLESQLGIGTLIELSLPKKTTNEKLLADR